MARNFNFSLWARNSVPMPGLLNVQSGFLRAPFERDLDVPGDCFCRETGRLPALHNGLDDTRRQECQADNATYMAGSRTTRTMEQPCAP
jgi:hypothetical protein